MCRCGQARRKARARVDRSCCCPALIVSSLFTDANGPREIGALRGLLRRLHEHVEALEVAGGGHDISRDAGAVLERPPEALRRLEACGEGNRPCMSTPAVAHKNDHFVEQRAYKAMKLVCALLTRSSFL